MSEITNKFGRDALEYIKPKMYLLKGFPRKNVPEFAIKIKAELVVRGTVDCTGLLGFFVENTAENILS